MLHSEAEYQSDFHGVVLPFKEAGAACLSEAVDVKCDGPQFVP